MSSLRGRVEVILRNRIQAAEEVAPSGHGKLDLDPLMKHLDEVIRIVEGVRDFSVEPYRERIHGIICSECRQDGQGDCVVRDQSLCGLEKYIDMIIAVIEQELKHDSGSPV